MKKVFWFLPFIILSCNVLPNNELYIIGDSPREIMESIEAQITKITDKETGKIEYWQTPEETVTRGYGDCEDICILFMYELNRIDIDSELIIQGTLFNGFHTYVKAGNVFYDPTNNLTYMHLVNTIESVGYDETMYYAKEYHTMPISGFFDGKDE